MMETVESQRASLRPPYKKKQLLEKNKIQFTEDELRKKEILEGTSWTQDND